MNSFIIYPSIISTDRLHLRNFNEGDEVSLFNEYCGDIESSQYLQRKPHLNVYQTKKMIEIWSGYKWKNSDNSFAWIISDRKDNLAIGIIIFIFDENTGEIHFGIGKRFQKRGLMTEALTAIIIYLKNNSNMNTIETFCHIENINAHNVLIRLGFTKCCVLKEWTTFPLLDKKPMDCILFKINLRV